MYTRGSICGLSLSKDMLYTPGLNLALGWLKYSGEKGGGRGGGGTEGHCSLGRQGRKGVQLRIVCLYRL